MIACRKFFLRHYSLGAKQALFMSAKKHMQYFIIGLVL